MGWIRRTLHRISSEVPCSWQTGSHEAQIPYSLAKSPTLLVDITQIGLPNEIYPPEGKLQSVPSLRFQTWRHAEQYLLGLGAAQGPLDATVEKLKKAGVAVLTIT